MPRFPTASLAVAACLLLLSGRPASAQSAGTVHVDASLLFTTRPAQAADYHYSPPMLGGTTPAVAFGVAAFAAPRVSVGGEFQYVTALSGAQVFNHMQHFSWQVSDREIYMLAVLRVHLLSGPIRLVPLFAIGPVFSHRAFTDGLYYSGYPEQPHPMSDTSADDTFLLMGGGAEVVAAVSPHAAIVGSFRVCTVNRDDNAGKAGYVGARNLTLQAGGGLRWTF